MTTLYRIKDTETGKVGAKALTMEQALEFKFQVMDRYSAAIAARYEIVEDQKND